MTKGLNTTVEPCGMAKPPRSADSLTVRVSSQAGPPGLRRDQVAALANMSTAYYESLEQAGGPQPSASVLASLVTALRLSPVERHHVYLLAGQAPPTPAEAPDYVDPGLSYTLDALAATTPALICDDLSNVVAQNPLEHCAARSPTGPVTSGT